MKIKLKDFKENEKVLAVARKHWFVFFREVLGLAILFVIPFFFIPFLSIFIAAGGGPVQIPSGFGLFFASLWALIIWQLLFARWTNYYYDVWIITNWRVIDIDQRGFYRRNVSTLLNLERIEDIVTEEEGFFGSLLHFGSLQIQTAASQREFFMPSIAGAQRIERIIRDAQEVRMRERN
jgi:membrane protein YdbS with pleckstrin-like domain